MTDIDAKLTATVTSGGRVTIPKQIRDLLNWESGCKLVFDVNSEGNLILRKKRPGDKRRTP